MIEKDIKIGDEVYFFTDISGSLKLLKGVVHLEQTRTRKVHIEIPVSKKRPFGASFWRLESEIFKTKDLALKSLEECE